MVSVDDVLVYLNQTLQPELFKDYCPNGLQVAGKPQIKRLITGVTASQALLEQAVVRQADAILVHHGYFWSGDDPCVTGMLRQRLAVLLQHNISLIAYHLPLDAHPQFGNNVQLAPKLDVKNVQPIADARWKNLGFIGQLNQPITGKAYADRLGIQLGRSPLHIPGHERALSTIAWCTGAAQDFLPLAVEAGADAYISGEISERTVYQARELGIDYFAAGHDATERYGVQALGAHLAQKFNINHEFITIDNPV